MFLFFFSLNAEVDLQSYLENRIPDDDPRYHSYLLALYLLETGNTKVIVETGTARFGTYGFKGDGGSTIILGDWATQNNAHLYSVDIDPVAINNAQMACQEYEDNIQFHCGDSITFLKNFGRPIDFLYLDSFDFDIKNPEFSQEHHLKEIVAAYPFLHKGSVVMVDDCDLPFGGKGKLIIDFLLSKNWKIVYEGYQVILYRPK